MSINQKNPNANKVSRQWATAANAGGSNPGTRFMLWMLNHFGIWITYLFLVPASMQYVLLDNRSKKVLRKYYAHLGIKATLYHYYRHFYSFGMSLIDRYLFLTGNGTIFNYEICHEEIIQNEVAKGHGVILLGAHFGNWELAGNLLENRLGTPINFVMLDTGDKANDTTWNKAIDNRRASVIRVAPDAPDTMVEVVNALRRGEIVCLHGDRILGQQRSEKLRFFDAPAHFPTGPFAISALTGAPVIPIFTVKTAKTGYLFTADDPVRIQTTSRDQRTTEIRRAIESYVQTLESMVRKYPSQWYNFYDFWGMDNNCENDEL